jgi:hypothetical protein
MSSNLPMTLKDLREALQRELDQGNKEKSIAYLQILERCNVTVNYIQESKEEKLERIQEYVRNKLIEKGLSKFDTNAILKSNQFSDHESPDEYIQRILSIPQVQYKIQHRQ